VHERVAPLLREGVNVLLDRYVDSSLAYQGAARGLGVEQVLAINRFATGELAADRTLLLRISPAAGRARQTTRDERPDRLEREDEDFFACIAAAYDELAAAEPQRIRVLDASFTPATVLADALDALSDLLELLAARCPSDPLPRLALSRGTHNLDRVRCPRPECGRRNGCNRRRERPRDGRRLLADNHLCASQRNHDARSDPGCNACLAGPDHDGGRQRAHDDRTGRGARLGDADEGRHGASEEGQGRPPAVDRRDRDRGARRAADPDLHRLGARKAPRVRAALAALAAPRDGRGGLPRVGDLVGICGLGAPRAVKRCRPAGNTYRRRWQRRRSRWLLDKPTTSSRSALIEPQTRRA
jgi:hypothetical protein